MLVLSRSEHESIDIGNDIRITVLQVRHGKVRLGVAAPRDVRVMRSELQPKDKEDEPKAA